MAPCDLCYDLDLNRLAERIVPHYHDFKLNELGMTFEALDASAESGCRICHLLRRGAGCFRPEYSMRFEDYSHLSLRLVIKERSVCGLIKVNNDVVVEVEFFTKPGTSCPYPVFGPGTPLMTDPESSECYEMVQKRIRECISAHSSCRMRDPANAFPKRLLDLGVVADGGNEPSHIRLYEPRGETAPYAALSHCWGTEPLLRTTLQMTRAPIEFTWSSLPKSFQDAAKVARNLGLRYLWIDSLCIVQDDPLDWEEEAAKMGSIYEGSYVTIAATSATGSTHGFLSQRQDPYELVEAGTGGSQFSVFVRKFISEEDHEWLLLPSHARTSGKELHPLLERGWCFQERMMASRVLHYTDREVVFECNSGYRCECNGMEEAIPHSLKFLQSRMMDPDPIDVDNPTREVLAKVIGIDKGWGEELNESFASRNTSLKYAQGWNFFAQRYSETKLTYQEDILPALSALANRMKRLTGDTYLAGLWKQHIPGCFLWVSYYYYDAYRAKRTKSAVATDASPLVTQEPSYIAPSFSWTSRVAKIRWWRLDNTAQQEVELLEADCKPRGSDPLGEVSSGFVKLRGRMIAVADIGTHAIAKKYKQLATGEWEYVGNYRGGGCTWDTWADFEDSLRYHERSYLLRIYSTGGPWRQAIALILRPAAEGSGAYRRVGLVGGCDNSDFENIENMDITIV
ncbi:hypothetical protein FGG08_003974 [Glutinoglossum americanum]|uniref:Heterokaryon incompatibility domain-containing protein n=1 Tax=Glutinoglossum americanum TaxID=1670608 RepID=A0A9P8ICA0_9PEZI|nr:hypothetical protein FGG08_003974 [Glutinoglossum americanum]